MTSFTRLAAPRPVGAFPPRSRAAPMTGADSGVLMVPASAFSPLTSSDFPWIFVWPNLAPCFRYPKTRFCVESMSMNARVSAPGSSGASRARFTRNSRCALPS